ncbi:site-specific integrase (plasmid) [Acaryochloris sp. 'Moss Beach']|uniref:tyrosine-type recombinase/integrase n=1 Tax=Acaryochloris sp. 'Moss Beach' TaxID=2740837 RepID=UPI001F4669A8|nr:site-specific integrase [Acaryochloris sp. 'Moss Beach']UJB73420.1 site-specific integrase [Acaryochloris sp. 'Moss Beach']
MKQDRFGKAGVLSPEQIHHLFSDGLIQSRDHALFGVCLYTGCRIGEACTLLTSDVINTSGPKSAVLFRWHQTKGKRDTREVPMHPQLHDYLVAYAPDLTRTYLFPGRHGRSYIRVSSADRILRQAFSEVGLEGFSTHSFRRTALTQMHNAGVPTKHIQRISGHRTLAALSGYLEVTDEQVEGAIAKLVF